QLLSEINSILKTDRGCDRLTQPCNKIEPVADTPSPAFSQRDRFWLQDNYPWIIVRLLPNAQHYVVGRFYSRTEAENHQRFLSRFMPAAEFEVTFEAPSAVATEMQNAMFHP
ncbi:MAG TPA: hypothetical protein V6D50_25710, partial [Chroococcales cyanobacterium]